MTAPARALRRRTAIFFGVACVAAIATAAWPGAWGGTDPATSADRSLGPTPPSSQVDVLLRLRLKEHALARYLRALQDPRSPSYGHYGNAAGFGARFALSRTELARLRKALAARGLRVIRGYPQRTAVRVRGSAAVVERTFGVSLRDYLTREGIRYHASAQKARVPGALSRWVVGAADLDTRPLSLPSDVPARTPGALLGAMALDPADALAAYDVAPLRASGVTGKGTTIAVVSFDSFVDSDISLFDRTYGLTGPAPQHVNVDGGTQVGGGHGEVNLDVQVVRGVAPDATILSYEAPPTGSLADVFNAILTGNATIVTNSWGVCEARLDPQERLATTQALQVAAYKGVTVFSASGDAGAFDCQRSNFSARALTVDFPADSPWAVAVGGTVLSVRRDGSYLDESGWQDPLTNGGGGGGLNGIDPKPFWQTGPGIDPNTTGRGLPDVAAASGINSPWAVYIDGQLSPVYGTSAATPFWAASMLLIQQYMIEKAQTGPLCFAAPLLYAVASGHEPYPPFHDVTRGGNRYYAATGGWDYVTGLGSPDVWNLARDLASYRQDHPLPQTDNACRTQAAGP